jgi:hypothetical protein
LRTPTGRSTPAASPSTGSPCAADEFSVGGVSATSVGLLPGVTLGQRRTFGVRGFPAGALAGSRAATATAEYRAPLAYITRGHPFLPVFLDRASVAAFGEAGSAWDGASGASPVWLASAGAELNVDLALFYDVGYRLRVGVAAPVRSREYGGAPPATVYVRLGAAF